MESSEYCACCLEGMVSFWFLVPCVCYIYSLCLPNRVMRTGQLSSRSPAGVSTSDRGDNRIEASVISAFVCFSCNVSYIVSEFVFSMFPLTNPLHIC